MKPFRRPSLPSVRALARFLAFLLLAWMTSIASPGPARAGEPSARKLVGTAERAVADVARAARARLGPEQPRHRPFWSSLETMDGALREARAALPAHRDPGRFHDSLERCSQAAGEVRASWARLGVEDGGITSGVRVIAGSVGLLRSGFGREAARFRQGGGLTAEERARFERLQRVQARFAESLKPLQDSARRRGDQAWLAELIRLEAEAWRIAAARPTLEEVLNARIAHDELLGEWAGDAGFVEDEDREAWIVSGDVIEELYVDAEVGHVTALDLGEPLPEEGGEETVLAFLPAAEEGPELLEKPELLEEGPVEDPWEDDEVWTLADEEGLEEIEGELESGEEEGEEEAEKEKEEAAAAEEPSSPCQPAPEASEELRPGVEGGQEEAPPPCEPALEAPPEDGAAGEATAGEAAR